MGHMRGMFAFALWDADLNWHEGQYWPEYLHLVDALGFPELKAPEMDY